MDLWVAAAECGAGLSIGRNGEERGGQLVGTVCRDLNPKEPEVVSSMDKQPIDQKRAESGGGIFSRFMPRLLAEDASSSRGKIDASLQGRFLDASLEGAFTSGIDGDALVSPGEYVRDHGSLLSLQPWVFRKESDLNNEGKMIVKCGRNGFTDASQAELSSRSIKLGYGPGRSRSSLRSRRTRRNSVRPLTSRGNCLIPQLYNEHFEIEDYVFSSLPSRPAPTMGPWIITDGNRMISRSGYDPLGGKPLENSLHKEVNGANSGVMENVIGLPSLPKQMKPKRKTREAHHERLDTSGPGLQRSCKLSHLQGSPDRMLLFCLGVSIGVIFSYLSNKREAEKLNNLLKDTENLVHDLQEELEMKESLSVMELANEACDSPELNHSYDSIKFPNLVPISYFPAQEDQYGQLHLPNAVDNSDSMSRIEAELEAELERLELNMNSRCMEGTVSSLGELDSDLIADVVHGELRADIRAQESRTDPYGDSSSSSSTPHTHDPNHAVSPRELSLCLHEVIQYRLEERIKELERELQNSQMEAEQALSQGSFSSSDIGSFNQESTTASERDGALTRPLCLDLTGGALDAYDEAYEEILRMTDTKADKKLYGDGLRPSNRSLIWGLEGGSENKSSTDVEYFEREHIFRSRGYDDESGGGGYEYEIDDEDGKMIQQIVERMRQGSPVVMHAQRMLLSPDK